MSTVTLCVTYPLGSLVVLRASFKRPPTQEEIDDGTAADADDLQAIDPDTVAAQVKAPNGDLSEHAYENSPDDIVRDDVGEYHLNVTGDHVGEWAFRFSSTGAGQAANEAKFRIGVSAFA